MKSEYSYLSNFNFLIKLIIIATLIGNIKLQQVLNCENDYQICNKLKCSRYSHCFYQTSIESFNLKEYAAECMCMSGYDTYVKEGNITNITTRCCYKLKNLELAFNLECFIGFGFGYLYLEKYTVFFIKFFFQVSLCCILAFSGYCLNMDNAKKRKDKDFNSFLYVYFNILNFILILIFIIWKIVDFIIFGFNMVTDANGMKLDNSW